MANNEIFTTTIKLNSEEAKNKLEELKKKVDDLKAKRQEAFSSGDDSVIDKWAKDLKKAESELRLFKQETMSIKDTLENIGSANIGQVEKAMRSLNRQLKTASDPEEVQRLQTQLQQCRNRIDEITGAHNRATTAAERYNRELQKTKSEMAAVHDNTELINRTLVNLKTSSVRELEHTIKAVNEELRGVERGTPKWKELAGQLKKCKTELSLVNAETREAESLWSRFTGFLNKNWGAITQIIATYSGTAYTIKQCVEAYAEMDEAMTDVRKYTGQTADEVERMNEDFKNMDSRTSREQLNELAGAAGRLGIKGTENIEEFVDAADKINVALGDDLGEKAVDHIGKLATMFGEDERLGLRGSMLATGSAVNELAQNSSAAAGYLVDFTARVAGVGKQAGLTQAQIMGFASVLDQNMQQDETSATAFQNLLTKMFQEPAKFAALAGQNVKTFSELLRTDANEAVLQFLQNMHNKGGFAELAPMFEEMNMDGSRATGVLSVMADKIGDIRAAQSLANEAYTDGTSVISEFNVQNESVQAQLDKARKKFNDLAVDLGQKLMPVARVAISTGSMTIKLLSSIITFVEQHITTIVALTAVIVALNAKRLAGIAVAKLEVLWNEKILASSKRLWAVLVANPYTAIFAAIVAVIGVIIDLNRRTNELTVTQKAMAEAEKRATESAAKEKTRLEQLHKIVLDSNQSLTDREKAIKEIQDVVPDYIANIDKEGKAYEQNTQRLDDYLKKLKQKALLEGAKDILGELGKKKAELQIQELQQVREIKKWYSRVNNTPTGGALSTGAALQGTNLANLENAKSKIHDIRKELKETAEAIDTLTEKFGTDLFAAEIPKDKGLDDTGGGGNKGGGSASDKDRYSEELAVLEESYKNKKNLLKQQYSEFLLSESEYHDQSFSAESEYLAAVFDLQGRYGKSQQDTQSKILDAIINETKYKYEQGNREMQSELSAAESSYNADRIALSQMYMNGEIRTEKEHKDKLLEAEENYQRQRLAIIQKYGGDTSQVNQDINKIEFDKFKQQKSTNKNDLEKQYQAAGTPDEMNRINDMMYEMDLISYEQYQQNKTDIAERERNKRKRAEEVAYQAISQLLSGASAYAQACSDLEVAQITKNYDKQIEAAGKNKKQVEKLEKERDKKIAEAKSKANKKAMKIEIAQATASTAMAAINAYSSAAQVPFIGYILAPIAAAAATAAGLLQIATIKKQHQAQEAGYYEGGFTGGRDYRRRAGVVHEGEFVANHQAVNNTSILPALQLIDMAQRNNTVGSLTAADVSRAVGGGGSAAVVAPVVNVTTDNEELKSTISSLNEVIDTLNIQLTEGIHAEVSIDGRDGIAEKLNYYNRLKNRK
ncbi:MAG: phage tail tape measure protein [Prevotella sp.]|nr:phage tail tape measure protein [Prevotella sp.]